MAQPHRRIVGEATDDRPGPVSSEPCPAVLGRLNHPAHSSKEETHVMAAAHNVDLPAVLADRLTTTHPDVLGELLSTFIHTLMGAEADALCGAGYGERSTDGTNSRNGYRHRQFDTPQRQCGSRDPQVAAGLLPAGLAARTPQTVPSGP